VEHAVGQDLRADVAQRLARHKAQEMVPLQHLVQQDAVEEAAQGEAEHARGDGRAPTRRRRGGLAHRWWSPFGSIETPLPMRRRLARASVVRG
jgi:hypothetical protein